MAIYSDAGALVGTWWNQVTQPQARGPITETTVNPAALTARTDLDEAQQALGQPLPVVIGTGRVDGVYFIGGVETVATVTYTTTTDNTIPPGYQAVSGTMGGQTFLFGPGPRTTTTSTTTYDNRTLAGYVLAYDVFERGYDLIRLEIDGAVVFDAENSIPETTTFRFYGGRHTTVDPILTQIIGANPGAYQNFVMIFIDGYPADSPPSISAVISNATTDSGETRPILWTGTPPDNIEQLTVRNTAYDPGAGILYQLLSQYEIAGTSRLVLVALDVNTYLERYRVQLEGTEVYASQPHWLMAIRGTEYVIVRLAFTGSAIPRVHRIYNAVTGTIVAEHVEVGTPTVGTDSENISWFLGLPFGNKWVLLGHTYMSSTANNDTVFGIFDPVAGTISIERSGILNTGHHNYGRVTSSTISFFLREDSNSRIVEATYDGTAWTYRDVATPGSYVGLWYDPGTGYVVVCRYDGTNPIFEYIDPVDGSVLDSWTADQYYTNWPGSSFTIGPERYWPAPGYLFVCMSNLDATGTMHLLDVAGRSITVYASDPSMANHNFLVSIFDQNHRLWITGFNDDVWTVHTLPGSAPRLIDLDQVVTDCMSLAGFGPPDLTFYGFEGLQTWGFVIAADTTIQAVVRAISDIYGFAWCDTGSGFVFKKAGTGALLSVDAAFQTADIVERDQPVMSQDEANIRTPSAVEMQYVSKEGQYKTRPTSFNMTVGVLNSITTPKFSTPILFNDAEAQRIVQEKFFEFQEKRRTHTLAVAPENITLLPGDIVSFPSGTRTYITRVEEIGIDLRNMGVEISARDFQTDVESPITAVSNTGPVWLVVHHASGDVTGQTLAVSVGTVTVTAGAAGAAFAPVTGQTATVSVGTAAAAVGGATTTVNVTGQAITASIGTATVSAVAAVTANVTGQSLAASVGAVTAGVPFTGSAAFTNSYEDLTTSSSTRTLSSCDIGAADAGRIVAVAIGAQMTSPGASLSGVTIGGVTATQIAFKSNSGRNMLEAVYAAAVPTGTTATVVISSPNVFAKAAIGVHRLVGYSITPYDTDALDGANNTASTIDIAANGYVVAAFGQRFAGAVTWTNATADFSLANTSVSGNTARYSGAHYSSASAVSGYVITANVSDSTTGLVTASFTP